MDKLNLTDRTDLYENIIENNWDAIVFANMQGIVEFVNSAANELYGYEGDELIGQNVDIFNSHLTHNTEDIVNDLIAKGHWYGELIQRRKDDSVFDALLHVQIIKDKEGNPIGYASNSKNISQDKETAKKLKQIIAEKEILIREIHHRVKNNLSIVQGMLRLQESTSRFISLEEFLSDFQTRLSVLSEAHNNLSSSATNIQEISVESYFKKIVQNVAALFKNQDKKVDLKIAIEDSAVLLDKAIPCGLIINEVVTNSFKHGLRNGGELSVSLRNGEEYTLVVRDSGPGFDTAEKTKGQSLGMSLIDGLVDQLDGTYRYESGPDGTVFTLMFKP